MAIDTITHRDNLFLWLTERDILQKLEGVIQNKKEYNVPWVYTKYAHSAQCDHYHNVYFTKGRDIHPRCRHCWKVVIRPKNVVQLFDLYEFQKALCEPCKCGFEARPTTFGLWGGYFYQESLREALARYKQVREWADKNLGEDVPVICKRYCTEFEIGPDALGPSNELPLQTQQQKINQMLIERHIGGSTPQWARVQPDYSVIHVMVKWIRWAHQFGDASYKQLTGGVPLYPPYYTYHDKSEETIREIEERLGEEAGISTEVMGFRLAADLAEEQGES